MIGLPPTPEELAAFLADDSPRAFDRVVDRLLESPQYGERWGRHFMDIAHYADTAGDNADYPIPEARLYRDYIIDSFNADKPYDQFVREQLAGDILARAAPPGKYAEMMTATTYLALSRRFGTEVYHFWPLTMEDTIDTVSQSLLGLTMRCARCHDHKFDPITMDDYYGMYGIFASAQFAWTGGEDIVVKKSTRQHMTPLLPPAEAAPKQRAYEERLKKMRATLAESCRKGRSAGPRDRKTGQAGRRAGNLQIRRLEETKAKRFFAPAAEVETLTKQREDAQKQLSKKLQPLPDELRKLELPVLHSRRAMCLWRIGGNAA